MLYTNLLRHVDFYVMPLVNVDGYDFTWKKVGEDKENETCPIWGYRIHRLKYRLSDLGIMLLFKIYIF